MTAIFRTIGIRGAVAGVFAILALFFWVGWSKAADSRDDWQARAAMTQQKLVISNQSIVMLEGALSRYVGAGKASRVAQLAAIEAQSRDNAKLHAQAAAIRAEMEAMTPDGRCETPESIKGADL